MSSRLHKESKASTPRRQVDHVRPARVDLSVQILRLRSSRLLLLALFIVSLSVYTLTCARTVTGEDSGELIAAAYTTGVAHPPGYPLWCILAKGATLIPVGSVAFRVAMLSACLGALTTALLAAVLLVLGRSMLVAAAGSLVFAFMRDQWGQAVIAEVYTLNSVLLAACILLLLAWAEKREWKWLYWFSGVYALSLSNHHLMAGLGPVFLGFLLLFGWRLLKDWRRTLVAATCFLGGLLPYAYLPLAARTDPAINWGDPSTLSAFMEHVTRGQYIQQDTDLPVSTAGRFAGQVGTMIDHAVGQGCWPIFLLGAVALLLMLKRNWRLGFLIGGIAIMSTFVAIKVVDFDTDFENTYASRILYPPAWMALIVAAGWLIGLSLRLVPHRMVRTALAACLLAVPAALCQANWDASDYSGYDLVDSYGRRLLASVEQNAVVFPTSDHNTFPILYLQFVEGLRPDVTIGDKYGYLEEGIYADSAFSGERWDGLRRTRAFRKRVEDWVVRSSGRPTYFTRKRSVAGQPKVSLESEGLWYRAHIHPLEAKRLAASERSAWSRIGEVTGSGLSEPHDFTALMVVSDEAFALARQRFASGRSGEAIEACFEGAEQSSQSKEMLNNFASLLAEQRLFSHSEELLRKALEIDKEYVVGRRNMATVLQAQGRQEEAEALFTGLYRENGRDIASISSLAEINRRQKKWVQAAFFLEEKGKLTGDAAAFRDAGLMNLMELREYGKAKQLLRVSLSIDPTQKDIRDIESKIREARPRKGGGKKSADRKRERPAVAKPNLAAPSVSLPRVAINSQAPRGVVPPRPRIIDPIRAVRPRTQIPKLPASSMAPSPTGRLPGMGAERGSVPSSPKPRPGGNL